MKRPITIASGQFGDLSLEELCKLVSSIGYEGIEIACQAHINVHKVLEDDAYVAQFRATLEKYGLKVWALGAHLIGQCVGDNWDPRRQAGRDSRMGGGRDENGGARGPKAGHQSGHLLFGQSHLGILVFLPADAAKHGRGRVCPHQRAVDAHL